MLVGSALLVRRMRLLEMGDDTACALGVQVERSRLLLMLVAVVLTAASTALAGPISYRAGGAAYRPPPERHGPLGTDPVGPVRRAAAGAGRLRRPTAVYAVAAAGWRVNRQPRRYLPYCIVDSGVPQKMSAVPSRLRGEQLTPPTGTRPSPSR